MKKKISFLLALVMIISLLPAMGVSAATTTTVTGSPSIASDRDWSEDPDNAPQLKIKFLDNKAKGSVYLELTSGNAEWQFNEMRDNNVPDILGGEITRSGSVWSYAGTDYSSSSNGNSLVKASEPQNSGEQITIKQVGTDMVELVLPTGAGGISIFDDEDTLYVPLVVKATGTGALEVSVAQGGTTATTLTFANAKSGATTITIGTVKKFAETLKIDSIVISETRPGTFKSDKGSVNPEDATNSATPTQVIKLTAPSGFEWVGSGTFDTTGQLGTYITKDYFESRGLHVTGNDYQTLEIRYALTRPTTTSSKMVLNGVELRATDDAKYGDVNIKISGAGTTSESVLAGTYVTYGVTLTAEDKDLPVIYAGAYPKNWDDDAIKSLKVTFEEQTVESWYSKRKTNFSVNDGVKIRGVKFTKVENLNNSNLNSNEITNDYIANFNVSGGVYTLNDHNKIASGTGEVSIDITDGTKFTTRSIVVNPDKKAKIEMELYLSAEPGYTGPVTLTVAEDSGSSSKEMSADIATIEAPFSVETTSTDLSLGFQRLPVADILIKENGAEAIKAAGTHVFGSESSAPDYVRDISRSDLFVFVEDMSIDKDSSTVTIEDGDMTLDKTRFVGGGLAIQVKRESGDPSTIAITGTTITLDRVLPQGNFELRIGGSVCANYSSDSKLRFATFDKEYYVPMDDYAVVVTPADITTVKNAIGVTVGSNTLKVGTQTVEMDTAPFLETSGAYAYMMVPARFVTEAVGATISFDANTKTATVFTSDNRITTFQVGTNYITVNGTRVPITGPSVLIRDSRIFLPFRVLGEQVLGVQVGWFEDTQSATYIPAGADASVLGTTTATATTPAAVDTTDETTDETEE